MSTSNPPLTPVHGSQQGRFFHGDDDCNCFLPRYLFCGDKILSADLRPTNQNAATSLSTRAAEE
ncbi:MAG: transposase [Puniceicoccaceae bacterium]